MATIYTLVKTVAYHEGQDAGTAYTSVLASFADAEEAKAELDHICDEHVGYADSNANSVTWCSGEDENTVEIIKSEIPDYTLVPDEALVALEKFSEFFRYHNKNLTKEQYRFCEELVNSFGR